MTATNKQKSQQLSVKVKDGQLQISIGIALLAFAVQSQDEWPEEYFVSDIDVFSKSLARQLEREEEDGTTPVHRILDAAAYEVIEQGDDGVDEGNVEAGIDLAKSVLDNKAAQPSHQETDDLAITQLNNIVDAWEALPGGQQVKNSEVEEWLAVSMTPAINSIRGFLRRPRPDGTSLAHAMPQNGNS